MNSRMSRSGAHVTIENVPEVSEPAQVLLIITGLVFAWQRFREVRAPIRRGQVLCGVDLVLAAVLVVGSGWFGDLAASLARESVLILIAAGLVAGIAGLATTGLATIGMCVLGGGGQEVTAWFLTPLLIGAALRNVRLKPEMPRRPGPYRRPSLYLTKLRNGEDPLFPGVPDVLWGLLARVAGGVPLVVVLLSPEDGQSRERIGGAILVWGMLYCYDLARKPLLMPHRRSARTVDTGIFLVLLAVAAGPLGELMARWWTAQHASIEWWQLGLLPFLLSIVSQLVNPRFDGRRGFRSLLPLLRVFCFTPQLLLVCTVLPFLVGGVFHPDVRLVEASAPVLLVGLIHGIIAVQNSAISLQHVADVMVLVRASAVDRKRLITGWICDNFLRRRRWRRAPLFDYSLVRLAGVLGELSAESSAATAGLRLYLPWGGTARLDHTAADQLLGLAEQLLDQVDACFPPADHGPGTRLHHAQQTARADLALHRGFGAYHLNDPEADVAAMKQAADHYTAINAPSHAATVLIHTADRLSILEQHEAAAALLAEMPEDLLPVIRRLLLLVRASAAHRAHRTAAARTLLSTARAIPQHTGFEFRKAFLAEKVSYPSFADGALETMVKTELRLDREFGDAHPTRR